MKKQAKTRKRDTGERRSAQSPVRTTIEAPGPPCPAEDPRAGDKTPEVVAWFFRYRPEEAERRYRGRKFVMPDL